MKIIMHNVITSVRVLSGAFAMMLFMVAGVLSDAEPHVLAFGGIIAWILGYIIGMAAANILEQIDREIQLNPIQEDEDEGHKKGIGESIDIFQNMEMPRPD